MDDTLPFVNTIVENISILKLLLYEFELASYLKINFNKSVVYVLDNNELVHTQISSILNC